VPTGRTEPIDRDLVARLHRQAKADRWAVSLDAFATMLEVCAARAVASGTATARDVERHLSGLHLEDLALACACAAGHDGAWEHFVLQHRPVLYRAADAIDPTGGARELADSLYADLFGLPNREGDRASLFRYFHGRSSLATWLRAVLTQRHVDRVRVERRLDPLPDDDPVASTPVPDPDRERYSAAMQRALGRAIDALAHTDRLRLALYYAQELTLAKIGNLLGESEATASRQLARTRRGVRETVERSLAADEALGPDQIARCFECATEDPGTLDLRHMLATDGTRKEIAADRSTY
jgi:RNA polymerase sigma-70 factor (ECF subfamily)